MPKRDHGPVKQPATKQSAAKNPPATKPAPARGLSAEAEAAKTDKSETGGGTGSIRSGGVGTAPGGAADATTSRSEHPGGPAGGTATKP